MSAINDAMGAMARAAADAMLCTFGGGALTLTLGAVEESGTQGELGYAAAIPPVLTIDQAHGRMLGQEADGLYELLVSANELEGAADANGFADVFALMAQCEQMAWSGKTMTVMVTEPVCTGGAAYAYRIEAKENGMKEIG